MFDFIKIGRSAVAVTALAALLVSCATREEDADTLVGYLMSPSLEVDLTVDDLLLTKALDFEVEEPSVSDIRFVVTDAAGNVKYDSNGLWTAPLVLSVGEYTIDATYGSNGFGAPYFKGSVSGSIEALDNESVQIPLALANSLVRVTVAEELAAHFTPGTEVVMNSGAYTAAYGGWFYAPSGTDLTASLAGTNSAGNEVKFEYTLSAPSAKVAYNVVCEQSRTDWPTITLASDLSGGAFAGGLLFSPAMTTGRISAENIAKMVYQLKGGEYSDWTTVEVSDAGGYKYISGLSDNTSYSLRACIGSLVSAESVFSPVSFESCLALSAAASHTKNGAGELSGTEANATVSASLPSLIAEVSTVTASGSFKNAAAAERSSFASTALSGGSLSIRMDNASGWPYIPQGSHTLDVEVVCTLPGGHAVDAVVSDTDILVPAPEFDVLLSAYTSYDKAKGTNNITRNVTEANSCDPATLYNLGASWTISDEIMANANYAKTLIVDFNGDTSRTYNVTGEYGDNQLFENKSGLAWTSYTLQATFTFDGVTVTTDKQTHHVTGLPYNKSRSILSKSEWNVVSGSADFGSSYVQLSTSAGSAKMASPTFHIPEDTDVKVYAKIGKGGTATYQKGYCVQYTTGGSEGSTVIESNSGSEVSADTQMTPTYCRWLCSTDALAAWVYIRFYYMSVEYR